MNLQSIKRISIKVGQNNLGRVWISLMAFTLIAVSLGSGGCFGPSRVSENVQGSDDVFFPTFRATVGILPPEEGALAAEIDFASGAGKSSQRIGSGDFLNFEDLSLDGPAELSADYKLKAASFAIRGGVRFNNGAAIEGIGGLGFLDFDLELESGGIVEHDKTFTVGPILGAQLTLQPISRLNLYGRGSLTAGSKAGLFAGELGAEINPFPHFAVFGGWRWWNYIETRGDQDEDDEKADIELTLSGPTAGIRLTF